MTEAGYTGAIFDEPYRAPELERGEPASPAADVFSPAATLACMVGGVYPFLGKNLEERALSIRVGLRKPLPELEPLRPLLDAALSPDPAARPSTKRIDRSGPQGIG